MISKHNHTLRFILGAVVVAVFAAGAYWVYLHMGKESQLTLFIASYGYIAALVLGFVGGFHFILPFPSIVFIPVFMQAGLKFWLVALLLATGMTAAYLVEYMFAKEGWHSMHNHLIVSWTKKLHRWRRKHKALPLGILFFYSSLVPAPSELSLPVFAALGYKITVVVTIIFLGNILYCGVYGSGLTSVFAR